MGRPEDSADFEGWLDRLGGTTPGSEDDNEMVGDPVTGAELQWLRRLYDVRGPVEPDDAWSAFYTDLLALAGEAVAAVMGDLRRTTSHRPRVVVDLYLGTTVRISIDEGYTTPSMSSIDHATAFVEVADYFQTELAYDLRLWPQCERHNTGLHPEVRGDKGVWCCRLGKHDVGSIGHLPSNDANTST